MPHNRALVRKQTTMRFVLALNLYVSHCNGDLLVTKKSSLGKLIASLQQAIANGGMKRKTVVDAIETLSELGYKYDGERFPALADSGTFSVTNSETPSNLAEALLWKLGKWKSYKQFSAYYMNKDVVPKTTDVVFLHLPNT